MTEVIVKGGVVLDYIIIRGPKIRNTSEYNIVLNCITAYIVIFKLKHISELARSTNVSKKTMNITGVKVDFMVKQAVLNCIRLLRCT